MFIEAWSAKFQSEKYPIEFYIHNIKGLQIASSPEKAGEHIINLLHWKDGKVRIDSNGDVLVGNENYTLLATKPNTYNETRHKEILSSIDFYHWVQEVKKQNSFEANKVNDLANKFDLYGRDSLVIPAFILHIISPLIYPLYDQHVERAKRALLAENISFKNRDIHIVAYKEYQSFLQDISGNNPTISLEEVKKTDNALWSFGKWLKGQHKIKAHNGKTKKLNENHFTPNNDFKKEVLDRISRGNTSQKEVMKSVAVKFGVTLPDSYYKYPGSHINRWRKQSIY